MKKSAQNYTKIILIWKGAEKCSNEWPSNSKNGHSDLHFFFQTMMMYMGLLFDIPYILMICVITIYILYNFFIHLNIRHLFKWLLNVVRKLNKNDFFSFDDSNKWRSFCLIFFISFSYSFFFLKILKVTNYPISLYAAINMFTSISVQLTLRDRR